MARIIGPFTALFVLLIPASAGAGVFCAPSPCAGDSQHPTVAAAAAAAGSDPGADTVAIGPGTFNLGNGVGIGQPDTDVRGAGTAATILTANPPTTTSRQIISGNPSGLRDLTLRLPSAVTAGPTSSTGADLSGTTVERVRIDAIGATFGPGANDGEALGMLLRSGRLDGVEIALDPSIDGLALRLGAAASSSVELEDVTITGPEGILNFPGGGTSLTTARRMRITSPQPLTSVDGMVELSDSVIDTSGAPPGTATEFPIGVTVGDQGAGRPGGLTLDRVSFIGNGDGFGAALRVIGQGATPATYVNARHIVTKGFARTLVHTNFGTVPAATIAYSNVATDASAIAEFGSAGPPPVFDLATGNRSGDPLLGADLIPALASPAVDIGGDDLLPGGPTDLAGAARPADGDSNGSVLNDAGAFERQYTANGATLSIVGKRLKLNRNGVGRLKLSCPDATEQPPPCTATVRLRTAKRVPFKGKRRRVLLARAKPKEIASGETGKVRLKLSAAKLELVEGEAGARRVIAEVGVVDGNDEAGSVQRKLKLRPRPAP